ncbi:MAG: CDP-glycerol glycerophosphotransferase family protein, partial [Synergistaceae bacterium]|nr:CDP-glycerol glycerophosphotransferase family protein [Synergistaceae bacterium]
MNSILPAVIILVLFAPSPAYAYLDPGTGNALIYLAVSLIGALAFSFKNVFWKIFGKKNGDESKLDYDSIAIFSEGSIYWNTFEPIINALIEINQPFSYYTMDMRDPGLTISNRLMRSKYIGDGAAAFAKIGALRSKILLATTPNIGVPGFPMPRPKYAERIVHVFHSMADLSLYKKGSLDHYDAVLLAGEFAVYGIRYLERLRGLKEKELIPAGLPYLDNLASKIKNPLPPTDSSTILIAPSWGTKSCLSVYGGDFIKVLAAAGFNIILRPHPYSW